MARAIVRGADPEWTKEVYSFALKPDIVIYLRVKIEDLITRVVQNTGFNYWESGMDLHLGEDMYDSFVEYQKRLLTEFDHMAKENNFHAIDADPGIEDVFNTVKNTVEPLLKLPHLKAGIAKPPSD